MIQCQGCDGWVVGFLTHCAGIDEEDAFQQNRKQCRINSERIDAGDLATLQVIKHGLDGIPENRKGSGNDKRSDDKRADTFKLAVPVRMVFVCWFS